MPAIKIGKAKQNRIRFDFSPVSEIPRIFQLKSKGVRSDLLVTCATPSVTRLTTEVQLQDDKEVRQRNHGLLFCLLVYFFTKAKLQRLFVAKS